ncbi:ICMT-domain-containing protein [Ganoderma leucocontextum]|nr:ICMT-domain-containing protein [Ganoderma leucocontextum]
MSSLAPVLCTPLLKIPLLIGNAVFTRQGLTPPDSPSTTVKEWKREDTAQDFFSNSSTARQNIIKTCSATTKYVLAGFALAEVSVILAQRFPSAYSTHVLAFLGNPDVRLTPVSAIGTLLGIAGGLVRVWCHRALGRLFTWEMSVRENHELITNGLYSVVRHPSYTGIVLVTCGNIIFLASKGSYFVEAGLWNTGAGRAVGCILSVYLTGLSLVLCARARQEDVMLRKEFGARWDEWAKQTPWRVIPFIY